MAVSWKIFPVLVLFALTFRAVGQPPSEVVSEPETAPSLDPEFTESDFFFREYARAARLVDQGGRDEAAIVMTLLNNKLQSTPWLEISTLKLGELVETSNPQQALDGYDLILKRVANAPYFREDPQRGRFFGAALKGAVEQGIRRVRLRKLRRALDLYFARYQQYPENLAKLAVFNFVEAEDILDLNNRPFRYLPTGQQFRPQIVYLRYELEAVRPEPFVPPSPRLESTTRLSEDPITYGARISMPGRTEPIEVREDQSLEGYYVATIARSGIVLGTHDRVLVIPVR